MLIKIFDDNWNQWLDHHLQLQSDKELLFVVLLNNHFEWEFVQKKLDYTPKNPTTLARKERQKRLHQEDWSYLLPLYPILADNPYVQKYDTGLAEIYELENALTSNECDIFKKLVLEHLEESTVTDPYAQKTIRTSRSAVLKNEYHPVIAELDERLHKFMRIPLDCSEKTQGHVYEKGQEFKGHLDYFDFSKDFNKPFEEKGQRLWTILIYLDEPESGGNTVFTKLDIEFKPVKGKALIWRNCFPNKIGNSFTEHSGAPVLEGQKTVLTKWFREYKVIK